MILGGKSRATSHRAPAPTDRACPVCYVGPRQPCRALDSLPLPAVHPERTESTPLFDELVATR